MEVGTGVSSLFWLAAVPTELSRPDFAHLSTPAPVAFAFILAGAKLTGGRRPAAAPTGDRPGYPAALSVKGHAGRLRAHG